jgi:hypothetical protein
MKQVKIMDFLKWKVVIHCTFCGRSHTAAPLNQLIWIPNLFLHLILYDANII